MKTSALWIFLIATIAAARPGEIQPEFQNLNFAQGAPGQAPPGWRLGPEGTAAYTAQIVSDSACRDSKQCGSVRYTGAGNPVLAFLYQAVDAAPYRGKHLIYRAAVRADVAGSSVARLLARIHREDGSTSFRDDLGDHPITAGPWASYAIDAPIASDARDIEFGMQLVGEGSASIDDVSLSFDNGTDRADVAKIHAVIRKFADARNTHDGDAAAALYSADGEWINPNAGQVPIRGRKALSGLWGDLPGYVKRSIESIDFAGTRIATVRVTTDAVGRFTCVSRLSDRDAREVG